MGEIYTIVFNSRLGNQKNTVLSSTSVVLPTQSWNTYSFDWNLLPAGKYRCQFSFISMGQTTLSTVANNKIPTVYMNCGNTNIYGAVDAISVKNTTSQYIGFLVQTPLSTTISSLYADKTMNQPFYLERPTNNQMEIKIYDNANPPAYWTDATALASGTAPFCSHYVLTLFMEKI